MSRAIVAIALMLPLSGCAAEAVSKMSPAEIQGVSDQQVCAPFAHGPVVMYERARRGLGDCLPPTIACVENGYPIGTPGFLACREQQESDFARTVAEEAEAAQAAQLPQPTRTCTPDTFGPPAFTPFGPVDTYTCR